MPENSEETAHSDLLSPTRLAGGALVAVLLIGAVCFAMLADAVSSNEPAPVAAVEPASSAQPSPLASTTPSPTTTPTKKPTKSPTKSATKSATPTNAPTPIKTTTPAKASAPKNAKKCGDSKSFVAYSGNDTTTCEFVNNVAKAMDAQAMAKNAVRVQARSAATGKTYDVRCTPGKLKEFTCKGGNNGVIHLIPK